jgi:hypothetical protein
LILDTKTGTDNSAVLASNIHHLRHLESFQYNYHCTNHVIQQLAAHCRQLKKINVSFSSAVTSFYVLQLLQLQNLSDLNFVGTSVTSEAYSTLLSLLPNIASVRWLGPISNVIENIPTKTRYAITYFKADGRYVNSIARRFANISVLVLHSIGEDLSSLTMLNSLTYLSIIAGDYRVSNMQAALQRAGHRLGTLALEFVENVNMAHIVSLCTRLNTLVLTYCTFERLQFDMAFEREIPHFESLTRLIIYQNSINEVYKKHLLFYVNLKTFLCSGLDIMTNEFVTEAVRNGAFRNIVQFKVRGNRNAAVSKRTVELLLSNCEYLRGLGFLRSWGPFTEEDVRDVRNRARNQNFDLKIW